MSEFFFIVTGMYVCVGQCTPLYFLPQSPPPSPQFQFLLAVSRVFDRVKSLQSQ